MANINLTDSSNIEVVQSGGDISLDFTTTGDIGDLSTLTTTDNSSLVGAINEVNQIVSETVLYNNPSGTNGNVSLSNSVSNYSYIEIYYMSDSLNYYSKIYNAEGKSMTLMAQTLVGGTPALYGKTKGISISGTTISVFDYSQYCLLANSYSYLQTSSDRNTIYITRVVGHK